VTGAGGFIGLAVVERARRRGLAVRGLERAPAAARRAEAAGAEVVVGDVVDRAAVERACHGVDAVVHAAAVVEEDGDWELFRTINVEGTRNVAEAARDAGVGRLVHLSSVMVYGFDYHPQVTEAGPLRDDGNPYNRSKIESEGVVLALHDPARLAVTVLRPGDVYGPGSRPWIVRPLELMSKRAFALPDGGRGVLNHLYVDNLVDAIELVLDRPVGTGPFNLTDGRGTSVREFYGRLSKALGCRAPPAVPAPVLYGFARLVEATARMRGRRPAFTRAAIRFLTRPHRVSSQRARTELGWVPRVGLDEGLARTAAWWRDRG